MTRTIIVEGMACPHCEAKVKAALEAVDGVAVATASHIENNAVVTLTKEVPDEKLIEAVNSTGKFRAAGIE